MKRTKLKWVLIIAFAAIIIAVGIISLMNMNKIGRLSMNIIDRLPYNGFKNCFGFSLPEGAEIVSYNVKKPKYQEKPIYAFEIVFSEEQYEYLKKGLDTFAYKLHNETEYSRLLSDNPWEKERLGFFDNADILVGWSSDLWKEKHPADIIFYASTYNDVGHDEAQRIHRTFIMFTKDQDGLYRMYACTK